MAAPSTSVEPESAAEIRASCKQEIMRFNDPTFEYKLKMAVAIADERFADAARRAADELPQAEPAAAHNGVARSAAMPNARAAPYTRRTAERSPAHQCAAAWHGGTRSGRQQPGCHWSAVARHAQGERRRAAWQRQRRRRRAPAPGPRPAPARRAGCATRWSGCWRATARWRWWSRSRARLRTTASRRARALVLSAGACS